MQPEEIPDLTYFLKAYLHQDYLLDSTDDIEALHGFLNDNPPEAAGAVLRDLRYVIYSDLSDDEIRRLILQCGSFFEPTLAGIIPRKWLAEVEKEILERMP